MQVLQPRLPEPHRFHSGPGRCCPETEGPSRWRTNGRVEGGRVARHSSQQPAPDVPGRPQGTFQSCRSCSRPSSRVRPSERARRNQRGRCPIRL